MRLRIIVTSTRAETRVDVVRHWTVRRWVGWYETRPGFEERFARVGPLAIVQHRRVPDTPAIEERRRAARMWPSLTS